MDEKDERIAHLEGQLEAYQAQTKLLSVQLLSRQITDLLQRQSSVEKLVKESTRESAKRAEEVHKTVSDLLERVDRHAEERDEANSKIGDLTERVDRMAEFLTTLKKNGN